MSARLGIERRLRRLRGGAGRYLLLALDHGLPAGPLLGLEEPGALLRTLGRAPITGVVLNPGLAGRLSRDLDAGRGLIVHLSAGTLLGPRPTSKVISASVGRAVALGADGVSVQVHFGDSEEDRMLADAGRIVDDARALGLPVLGMAYPPSGAGRPSHDAVAAAHAARALAEVGADLVQTSFDGGPAGVREIVRGSPVPVLLAGGPRSPSPEAFLEAIRSRIAAGAAGVTVGRNLFQHPDPRAFAERIAAAVHGPAEPPVVVRG